MTRAASILEGGGEAVDDRVDWLGADGLLPCSEMKVQKVRGAGASTYNSPLTARQGVRYSQSQSGAASSGAPRQRPHRQYADGLTELIP